ncbi:HesA/MoeB/ThiF family protein [Oceanispirochaeta sp.]|jgi:molybdopterin/thiamine biosynthesis adenylyltransferase|uniref:HesA/MoeB/ThiF family protein n=1 Tax=Oceanispirochaeta sp. TaxID=2035350 RepID=UPI00262A0E42|nr:HesA/MoeB/ThiF family protein [Oceanispirochaeta sp.]MDA3956728.1 HesA/MoeB/ThiF family protein [Oceanispirochaeta sp.]
MYKNRYQRNGRTITPEENTILAGKKVFIAGAGGLGGYILEFLLRAGVGRITIIDPDRFDDTNLNRQILCTEPLMNVSKAETAANRAAVVNSEVKVTALKEKLTAENALELCKGHDILIDALDNIPARLAMQDAAEKLNIPMVHGAIAGSYGQVSVVMPGDRTLSKLYMDSKDKGVETELGNPSYTPAIVAGMEVNEALKVLLNKGTPLVKKVLYIDLLENEYNTIDIV